MKHAILYLLLLLPGTRAAAQLSLEECQEKARANYPVARQQGLIEQAREFDLANANKGYLPRLSVTARATYQTEVTRLPASLPVTGIKELDRDQYQLALELSQTIWDGGHVAARKEMANAAAAAEHARVEVELYALRDRVNQLFFGVLLAEEQLKYNALLQEELQNALEQVAAGTRQGVTRAADADVVRVELARVKRQAVEIRSAGDAYREMLGRLTGEEARGLTRPAARDDRAAGYRPELSLFQARAGIHEASLRALKAGSRPRVSLFVQGGYGNPGLNMLKNEFSTHGIGGVRLSWDVSRLYTLRDERRQVALQQEMEESRREAFLLNLSMEEARGQKEVEKWKEMARHDDEIVALHERVAASAAAGAREGTTSVLEWMREVNRLDQARQARAFHEMQGLLAAYTLEQTRGK